MFVSSNLLVSQTNNYNWITPNKTYLKMYITEEGIYRICKNDFTNAGITAGSIDPRTVKVLYKGNQLPIWFQGEHDGVFNDSDYFDFYGTRNSGGLTRVYNEDNQNVYTIDEYYNQYSDNNIYWIDWEGSYGQRITAANYNYSYNPIPLSFYYEKIHFEKDLIYSLGENAGGNDFRNFITEKFKGEGFYWSLLSNTSSSLSDTFSTPLLYNASENATVRVVAYPLNVSSLTNEHNLRVSINSYVLDTIKINDFKRVDSTFVFPGSYLVNNSVNLIKLKYLPAAGFTGSIYIDLMEVQYPKSIKFSKDGKLSIKSNSTDTSLRLFTADSYKKFHAPPISIYDVNKNFKINGYYTYRDSLKFIGKTNSHYRIVSSNTINKPVLIKQRIVPVLVSSSTGADYLIIYNKLFEAPAEQLRSYRQTHDNFRTVKAEIEDIYDTFNYGIEDPVAVRNFTRNIYETWQLPKLKYICLFGRGSLDPKKNLSTSVFYKNFVPVYGYPPSDGYYGNTNTGSHFYYQQIAVGRLPAYDIREAQKMVENIIAYENQAPSEWWKNFIFIAGGSTASEQAQRQASSNYLVNNFINPIPVCGISHKIYRSDTSGSLTFNYADSIRNDINRGALIVNFMGHAGSQDWEAGMANANVLSNNGRLPLILSMTCYTGKNSETYQRGFGETFMNMYNKGGIGFISTTGWSFDYDANDLNQKIFREIANDTLRRLGDIFKKAQANMIADSVFFTLQHTINCYCLLGDPACKLSLPKQPEFYIDDSGYKLSNDFPALNETNTIKIIPKNYGLNADSCKVRFQLIKNNINYSFKDTVLRNIKFSDTAQYNFKLDSAGNYNLDVILDISNWYSAENKNNNTVSVNLSVKNNSFIPLKPVNNSVIDTDSIEFTALNPFIKYNLNSVKVILQFDTSKYFNSLLNHTFINNNISGVTTKFKTAVPLLIQNTLYYWRTNSIINNDSSGWSIVQMFIYNTTLNSPLAEVNDFQSTDDPGDSLNVKLIKLKSDQFLQEDLSNTVSSENGIKLDEFTGNLYVRSLGSNGAEASYFNVNNKSIFIDGGSNTGLNMLKVNKINGSILQFKNFKMTYPNSSDSVLYFLNTFDSTQFLLALNASLVTFNPYHYPFNSATKQKMRQFGSVYADTMQTFGWFDTWSFIGYTGAVSNQVSEDYHFLGSNWWIPSTSSLNPVFRKTNGSVSNIIGPSQHWEEYSWQQTLLPQSSILFDVIGIDKNGLRTTLITNQSNYQYIDLNSINSYQYPKLDILAKFSIDTISGNQSSVLNSLKVNYTPPAELVLDINSFQKSDSISETGKELKIKFNYHNAGYVSVPGVIINIYKSSIENQNILRSDTVSFLLNADSSRKYDCKLIIPYFRRTNNGKVSFFVKVFPKGQYNELYLYNNYMTFELLLINNLQSNIEVYSDNKLIKSGDIVSKNPEIKIYFRKAKPVFCTLADSGINSLKTGNNLFREVKTDALIKSDNNLERASEESNIQIFHPFFNAGENKFRIICENESDKTDTLDYIVIVSDEFSIEDLYNYPNPMKNETNFLFKLTGSESSYLCVINIYTVSGRLIKKIKYNAVNGANQISWDGKDNDGDYISNGTYLYRMHIEGIKNQEFHKGKLAIIK